MSAPLALPFWALTAVLEFDRMHRRAGGEAASSKDGPYGHSDAHKNCPLGRCGTRPGGYHSSSTGQVSIRSAKITEWRVAKAKANRAYLEEHVYGKPKKARD